MIKTLSSTPVKNSSITTVPLAFPNCPFNMLVSAFLALAKSLSMITPLPAANPSALSTYGAF